jgi:3-oxochol-4-en-24-oyl-CoA dehydrogenase
VTRDELRSWLAANPAPTGRELAAAGLVAPHWPPPWGLAADADTQLMIGAELARADLVGPDNPIGIGWAGPTILAGGTDAQRERWLPGILDGSTFWCQLFSEPEAGSDLASLQTRAVRDGDEYVVTGQKLWSTWADRADWGILLARTDPTAPKHEGISYFVVDMRTPGIEVREVIEMTGGNHFNEVFLTDVRLPADAVVGEVDGGWGVALTTLANERSFIGGGAGGGDFEALVRLAREAGRAGDPEVRQRLAAAYTRLQIFRYIGFRIQTAADHGELPGPEASVLKLAYSQHLARTGDLGLAVQGAGGALLAGDAVDGGFWQQQFLTQWAARIGGGTDEIQRNVIGERVLGLPREPRPDKDVPFRELSGAIRR